MMNLEDRGRMFGWLRFNGCEKNCGKRSFELALTEPLETRAGRNQSCGDCKEMFGIAVLIGAAVQVVTMVR